MKKVLEFKVRVTVEDNGKRITKDDREFMSDSISDAVDSYAGVGELTREESKLDVVNVEVNYPSRATAFKE